MNGGGLVTPMLIHFSFAHLVFNCLWIYVLGSKIEYNDGHYNFFRFNFIHLQYPLI